MRLKADKWLFLLPVAALLVSGCGKNLGKNPARTMFCSGGRVKTLDPALASDLSSRNMVAAFYDTLLQYDYTARPYKLIPSMLAEMPRPNKTLSEYTFKLRDDLFFQTDKCFAGLPKTARQITAKDVQFSFLRIADGRLHSPVFWMFRGKVQGINAFRNQTSEMPDNDYSLYDKGIPGFEIIDDLTFRIRLTSPDPRFLYALAIPYSSIVSRRAVKFYGESFAERPVGSGPFRLVEWIRDYRMTLDRNPEFRPEYFTAAQNPADRKRRLPLLDRVVFNVIRQSLSSWLLFLQGGLDSSMLDKDNFDTVAGGGQELAPALARRGVKLLRVPEFEIKYIGFNFADPALGKNLNLRKALSLAYNVAARQVHFNHQLIPAQGPIPPGVAGYAPKFKNPYSAHDLKLAKKYLVKAGYPNGLDPATGQPLTLTFDQLGSSATHRQLAEMMVSDMKKIGVKIVPILNNKPRFFQKVRQGKFQLFRLSWVGDYPDAENFLQLFYSKNAGSCNRVFYRNARFDRMFEEIVPLPDSPRRTRLYQRMAAYVTAQCVWIFESFPVSYRLNHCWLENYLSHDFAFSRWKYLAIDPKMRQRMKKTFKPLSLDELRQ